MYRAPYLSRMLPTPAPGERVELRAVAFRYGSALEVSLYRRTACGELVWFDTFAASPAQALHELAGLVSAFRRSGRPTRLTFRIHPASAHFQGEGLPF